MDNFFNFICEKFKDIGTIKKHIKIKVNVEATVHSKQRQGRHPGDFIEDDEILKTANKSLEEVSKAAMYGKIDINDNIHVYDSNNDLNLICELDYDGRMLILRVVTVIRKKKFFPRKDDYSIKV